MADGEKQRYTVNSEQKYTNEGYNLLSNSSGVTNSTLKTKLFPPNA